MKREQLFLMALIDVLDSSKWVTVSCAPPTDTAMISAPITGRNILYITNATALGKFQTRSNRRVQSYAGFFKSVLFVRVKPFVLGPLLAKKISSLCKTDQFDLDFYLDGLS